MALQCRTGKVDLFSFTHRSLLANNAMPHNSPSVPTCQQAQRVAGGRGVKHNACEASVLLPLDKLDHLQAGTTSQAASRGQGRISLLAIAYCMLKVKVGKQTVKAKGLTLCCRVQQAEGTRCKRGRDAWLCPKASHAQPASTAHISTQC